MTNGFYKLEGGDQLEPGLRFWSSGDTKGWAEVLGPDKRTHAGLWSVRFPDGAVRPLRPSTILSAVTRANQP